MRIYGNPSIMNKILLRILLPITVVILLAFACLFIFGQLSTAKLDGSVSSSYISAPVSVTRDSYGVPHIEGESRQDIAFAMGYLHAQERFFQMDLLRRASAGELSELFGEMAINRDKRYRAHLLREKARAAVAALPSHHLAIANAYTQGVNQGLSELSIRPPEYWLLGQAPKPWLNEDSFLVSFSMWVQLNDEEASFDRIRHKFYSSAPSQLHAFIAPIFSQWEAPLSDYDYQFPATPSAELIDLSINTEIAEQTINVEQFSAIGSNNWAIAGDRTSTGKAILANDMHLGIQVPNTWYRVSFQAGDATPMVGVSLPGAPLIVAGSNSLVAWGFTNSYGDWSDLIKLELNEDKSAYRTNGGWEAIEVQTEQILLPDGTAVQQDIQLTRWGPILNTEDEILYATRWLAHEAEAVNLNLLEMEHAANVNEAKIVCNQAGIPPQNCTMADSEGNIGWTIGGYIPQRIAIDYGLPIAWQVADISWGEQLEINDYPAVINPDSGQIWTANAKVVSGEMLQQIGSDAYDLGARSMQIRDNLSTLENADEFDLFAIAYDDRALFYQRWAQHLTSRLAESPETRHQSALAALAQWNGRAEASEMGMSLVAEFRTALISDIYQRIGQWLNSKYNANLSEREAARISRGEDTVWQLLQDQPAHFLPSGVSSWKDYELAIFDELSQSWLDENGNLTERAEWRNVNGVTIAHPLSSALPKVLRGFLDMEDIPLNGATNMPLVQYGSLGASEHIVVTPSMESQGLYNMPGGQSGNPFSPFYRVGHRAWASALALPILSSGSDHQLMINPE